ncbi:MAG: flavin reductase family protein [Actinomycetaceae bacterium]|nr:flavin reductase family protein [Actinomycetaceae bacterium]
MQELDFHTDQITSDEAYKLAMSIVIPRPIAWISTVSSSGVLNLAPYALFAVVSTEPLIVQFSSRKPKDTWRNATEVGSFVVNGAPASLKPQVAKTSQDFPPEVNEFEETGLTPIPSTLVKAPRLKEARVSFECLTLEDTKVGGSIVTYGEVKLIHIDKALLTEGGIVDPVALDPLAKLGGQDWSALRIV